jgi:glutamate-1-semialdehyde 2,1-aminomutase
VTSPSPDDQAGLRTAPRLGSARAAAHRERAHELIPGGSHTYNKGDDQWPEGTPAALVRGEGCRVWDIDGNEFVEYPLGNRAVTLGYAYPQVVEAAQRQMLDGTSFLRPSAIELECAEELLDLVRNAEMVKFTKDGSSATTAALRLARAHTGRDLVALCGDHPFFSYDDWFIGTTQMPAGIPQAIKDLTLTFRYNDIESVRALFESYPDQIAMVILEAEKDESPRDGFLHELQGLCKRNGALFVIDELITGFRYALGGIQDEFGLSPDMSTFGKGMANGFSQSALVGRRDIMELGGMRTGSERVFLLSTTHGAETHALAAAIATMRVYREQPVIEALYEKGERLRLGIEQVVAELGLAEHFGLRGRDCNLVYFTRDADGQSSQAFRTLFLQEMVARGFLASSFVVSYAHGEAEIDLTIEAVSEALAVYARALEDGVEHHLKGRPVQPAYRPFN